MKESGNGKRGQSYGWNGAEGTGERQRGWQALWLTIGALCSLKGAGTMVVCVWGCRQGGLEPQSSSLGNQASCWGSETGEQARWRAHPMPEWQERRDFVSVCYIYLGLDLCLTSEMWTQCLHYRTADLLHPWLIFNGRLLRSSYKIKSYFCLAIIHHSDLRFSWHVSSLAWMRWWLQKLLCVTCHPHAQTVLWKETWLLAFI